MLSGRSFENMDGVHKWKCHGFSHFLASPFKTVLAVFRQKDSLNLLTNFSIFMVFSFMHHR